jgi:hypothetical protein
VTAITSTIFADAFLVNAERVLRFEGRGWRNRESGAPRQRRERLMAPAVERTRSAVGSRHPNSARHRHTDDQVRVRFTVHKSPARSFEEIL